VQGTARAIYTEDQSMTHLTSAPVVVNAKQSRSRFAPILLALTLAAASVAVSAQQPERGTPTTPADPAGQPQAGAPPTGEQNRNPAIDRETDTRGNDRDFTTARGDRGNSGAGQQSAGTPAGSSPVIPVAVGTVVILVVGAVLMAVRRSRRTPTPGA
jgi:hypothetical protein